MATYAIGDVQGCYHSLMHLLEKIDFNPSQDALWFVGDIVNRGTGSLSVLRWCYTHRDHIKMVLGNHDLHTIAVAHQIKKPHRSDTITPILNADDADTLLTWLRHQPLMHVNQGYVMVHAGIWPTWSVQEALRYAGEVETVLQSAQYMDFLSVMYGNEPNQWSESLTGVERLRFITNTFTRMRICEPDGALEYKFKGELQDVPKKHYPWFAAPNRSAEHDNVIFGHWSALGLHQHAHLFGLDTGCLWGRELTAMCLETRQITQVPCDSRDVN